MVAVKKPKKEVEQTLKRMVEAVKKDNLEFKEESRFEGTLKRLIKIQVDAKKK